MSMFKCLKNIFGKKEKPVEEKKQEELKPKKPKIDIDEEVVLGSNEDENYEYYKFEIENGAVAYMMKEDHYRNRLYDMDDLEDSYCYHKMLIKYENGDVRKRYVMMADCSVCKCYWQEIDANMSKEQFTTFLKNLRSMSKMYY